MTTEFVKIQHVLFVCKTCASTWKDGKRVGQSGGEKLFAQLQQLYKEWEFRHEFSIQSVDCLSACSHSCAVSFAALNKYTYLFGDLPTDVETLNATSAAVLECARQYLAKLDGSLPWAERPEPLKKGIIARIPPLPQLVASG